MNARRNQLDHLRYPQVLPVDPLLASAARISVMCFRLYGGGPRSITLAADATQGPLDIYDMLASWCNQACVFPESIDLRAVTIVLRLADPPPNEAICTIHADGSHTAGTLPMIERRVCCAHLHIWRMFND